MATNEQVTVSMSPELVKGIDRCDLDRSHFVAVAVARELQRRRHEQLRLSLADPHPESLQFDDAGFSEWAAGMAPEDAALVDITQGRSVRWISGRGWVEDPE